MSKINEKENILQGKNILKETFRSFKFKKSGQQMKDELRKELYND